jgi:hypothetical protein
MALQPPEGSAGPAGRVHRIHARSASSHASMTSMGVGQRGEEEKPGARSAPMSTAMAPQPPEGRAGPAAYMAMSAATTSARRPSHARDSTQLTALNSAAVPP